MQKCYPDLSAERYTKENIAKRNSEMDAFQRLCHRDCCEQARIVCVTQMFH